MKFCCVTPCLNAEKLIEITMRSVLSQTLLKTGEHELHYVIQDGDSSDNTLDIASRIADEFSDCKNIVLKIHSEADKGMYDALSKGFRSLSRGDIYHYINAGDYYSLYAFEIVFEVFSAHNIQFLTGLECEYNDKNHLINARLPFSYNKSLLLSGMYGTILPFVQQESTFWRYELQKLIDLEALGKMNFAGDFILWKTFIEHAKFYIVNAHLGGFRVHVNQLSTDRNKYLNEMQKHTNKKTLITFLNAYLYKILWHAPNIIKGSFSDRIFFYDHKNSCYRIGIHS